MSCWIGSLWLERIQGTKVESGVWVALGVKGPVEGSVSHDQVSSSPPSHEN